MERDWTENLSNWKYISRYSEWMFSTYADYIGKRVADIGAGTGNMTGYYLERAERVVAVDVVERQVELMRARFSDQPRFSAIKLDIMREDISPLLAFHFDTVVCVNVIEHIEDDALFLEKLASLVSPGGHVIVFAPAMQGLYSVFDENDGHYRRYGRNQLREYGERLGLTVCKDRYFNFFGALMLYLKGKRAGKSLKNTGLSCSATLGEGDGKLINMATRVLRPLERILPPVCGLSKVVVFRKP